MSKAKPSVRTIQIPQVPKVIINIDGSFNTRNGRPGRGIVGTNLDGEVILAFYNKISAECALSPKAQAQKALFLSQPISESMKLVGVERDCDADDEEKATGFLAVCSTKGEWLSTPLDPPCLASLLALAGDSKSAVSAFTVAGRVACTGIDGQFLSFLFSIRWLLKCFLSVILDGFSSSLSNPLFFIRLRRGSLKTAITTSSPCSPARLEPLWNRGRPPHDLSPDKFGS
ncbi:hypothetical protein K1719_027384 [Acacia pycnantha]|nr:hypothetical protein K1719_027384 [Acacia pycnantha]